MEECEQFAQWFKNHIPRASVWFKGRSEERRRGEKKSTCLETAATAASPS
jgi:hypothetical protein